MASNTKNVKLGVCTVMFDGVDLGYTKGGVSVQVSTETHKVQVDQFGNSEINEYIMGRTVKVTVPLAETTLENLVKVMPGATLVTGGGAFATGTITVTSNPSDGDTVTVNGVTWTFRDAGTLPDEVTIGATASATATALRTALSASADALLTVATYDVSGTTITVTYGTKGVDGNAFTLATSVPAKVSVSGTTLSGGVEQKKRVDATNGIGVSLLDLARKLVLHPVANDPSNKTDDFIIPRAGTAGNVSFAYKLNEERIYNVEFTGYPDPSSKVLFKVGDESA